MIRLTKSQILTMHEELLNETGGSSDIREDAFKMDFRTQED